MKFNLAPREKYVAITCNYCGRVVIALNDPGLYVNGVLITHSCILCQRLIELQKEREVNE